MTLALSYQSHADRPAASLAGSSGWTPEFGVDRLLTPQRSDAARTTGLTATIRVDLGRPLPITMIAFINHTLSTLGQWSIAASLSPDLSSPRLDTGPQPVWPVTAPLGAAIWGLQPYVGRAWTSDGNLALMVFARAILARYVLIRLNDENRPDRRTWLDIGRLVIDAPYRPRVNIGYGWSVGWNDPALEHRTRSRGGVLWTADQPKYRTLTFELFCASKEEALDKHYEIDRIASASRPVLAIIDPDDPIRRHKSTIYGFQSELAAMTEHAPGLWSTKYKLEESL